MVKSSASLTVILFINIIISINPLINSVCQFVNPVILLESNNLFFIYKITVYNNKTKEYLFS